MVDEIEDGPQAMPEIFRASLKETDEAAHARLLANDAAQKELRERVNTPFAAHTPKERERANAFIMIDALENARTANGGLSDAQLEQLAESYAAIGEYERAAELTPSAEKAETYRRCWTAVWLDDAEWCRHPERHKYIRETVFSVRESREMPLLACNACGTWNVLDAPEHLINAQRRRARVRVAVKGMSPEAVKRYLGKMENG